MAIDGNQHNTNDNGHLMRFWKQKCIKKAQQGQKNRVFELKIRHLF